MCLSKSRWVILIFWPVRWSSPQDSRENWADSFGAYWCCFTAFSLSIRFSLTPSICCHFKIIISMSAFYYLISSGYQLLVFLFLESPHWSIFNEIAQKFWNFPQRNVWNAKMQTLPQFYVLFLASKSNIVRNERWVWRFYRACFKDYCKVA